jgi:hypothetical protein
LNRSSYDGTKLLTFVFFPFTFFRPLGGTFATWSLSLSRPSRLPQHRVGARREPDVLYAVPATAQEFFMSTVLALKGVCKLLGLRPYQIQHAYSIGAVPEPRTRISGRRVFELSDVQKLARHFHVTLKADAPVAAESAE